ncbi:MAG: ATP-binding cassette domain-containing protein [Candidatus Odinarchaeota archaeon]|nr:ATP-binding cassette domain-containing protein [Candidatus Odinarchaeota archaeon]
MSEDIIVLEDVWIKHRGQKEYALKGINLKVRKGERLGIIGPTGAGKSTLCTLLNGLIPNIVKVKKMKGNVIVKGMNTREHKVSEFAPHIGIVFQDYESQIFRTNVEIEVAFGPENLGMPRDEIAKRIKSSLEWTRLTGLERRYTHGLSGGQKQRLAIASILAMQPEILVLDEATSDLDPIGKYEIYEVVERLMKEREMTLIMVDHHLDRVAEIADRIIVLNKGELLYDGTPEEVFSHVDDLISMGLRPPQVAELFSKLGEEPPYPLTVDDAVSRFPKKFKFMEPPKPNTNFAATDAEPAIEIRDLWHTYDGEYWALKGINLRVNKGDFLALIGNNGSGKTTLAMSINGIITPTKGSIKIFGHEATEMSIRQLGAHVGYVFQNPDFQLVTSSVRDEIELGLKQLKISRDEIDKRVSKVLKKLNIEEIADEDPFFLNKANRQRVAVASVLALEPEIVILDEPTTGITPGETRNIMELAKAINKEGKTVIIITHDMWLVAEYTKRIIVLKNGRILMDGHPRHIFAQEKILEESFIEPPQICRFSLAASKYNYLSVDELIKHLERGE